MLELAGIVSDSIVDGPGIRTTIFCQGCPHRCEGCHNPETWESGCGTVLDTEAIVEIITSNPLSRAVTFSGGEPFAQAEGFAEVAEAIRPMGYEIASYSGYTFEQLANGTDAQKRLLASIDVLIDGPFVQEQKSLELSFRGSRNQRIIDVKKSLAKGRAAEITSGRWAGEF